MPLKTYIYTKNVRMYFYNSIPIESILYLEKNDTMLVYRVTKNKLHHMVSV
jgi:hypothetical protein